MATQISRKAAAALVAVALMLSTGAGKPAAQAAQPKVFNVVPIVVTSVTVNSGQLFANGLVGTRPFQVPMLLSVLSTGSTASVSAAATCPILNLSIGAINLNLLGLHVNTSDICLNITAIDNAGLLGDLLCGIAKLLQNGVPLNSVLSGLTSRDLGLLNRGLTQMLNQAVFVPLSSSSALQSAECDILHLALGPIDLNLLGLRVQLNDCAQGPVLLDITADPAGGLLGQLLCGLATLLQGGDTAQIAAALQKIASLISALAGLI